MDTDAETTLGGTKNEICMLMDKLSIRLLELMEELMQCKANIEKRTNEGNLLLAKTRYIQGANSVSVNQLPTENSPDFKSLINVEEIESDDNLRQKKYIVNKFPIDKVKNYLDPTKWFGVLVPRSLQFARERYQLSIDLVIDCANIQRELEYVMWALKSLRDFKETWKGSVNEINNIGHTSEILTEENTDILVDTKIIDIKDTKFDESNNYNSHKSNNLKNRKSKNKKNNGAKVNN